MPIPVENLERVLVPLVLTPAATVAELLALFAAQPEPQRCFAVVRCGPGAYDALALDDLRDAATIQGRALLPLPIGAVPGLIQPGAPAYQSRVGLAAAEREQAARHRRRLVVLADDDAVAGLLVSTNLAVPKGDSPLALLRPAGGVLGDPAPAAGPPAAPHLNTRFENVGPNEPLVVGRRVPLIVSVGASASGDARDTRPFAFAFADISTPVRFTVRVDGNPDLWTIREIEPTLIVVPPGATQQEAEFLVTVKQRGQGDLLVSVEQADGGALVQRVWLPVTAVDVAPAAPPPAPAAPRPRAQISLPLDAAGLTRPAVDLTIQPGAQFSQVVVRADLPGGVVRQTYQIPISKAAIQNAALRLRQELTKVVFFWNTQSRQPFISLDSVTIDPALARQAYTPLADAGAQVWDMLFNPPRDDGKLHHLASDMRALPPGSRIQITLDDQEFIVPWALLYDQPGAITTDTLTWEGFWGYRYAIDVLPPGRYPPPAISDPQPWLLFNDGADLHTYTTEQERVVREELGWAATVVRGDTKAREALMAPPPAALVYCYCHGEHTSGAVQAGALAGESAVLFSPTQRLRVADLRRLPAAALAGRPLVFLNACEGATQDAFYYDGFMPFFIEQQLAQAFIGTEVKAPIRLAHEVALQFLRRFAAGASAGEILWQLRREYLDQHHNILAFNYSLYGNGDVRLALPPAPLGAPA